MYLVDRRRIACVGKEEGERTKKAVAQVVERVKSHYFLL